jgi:protease-4
MRKRHFGGIVPFLLCLSVIQAGCISVNLNLGGRSEMKEKILQGSSGPKILLLDIDGEITDADSPGFLSFASTEGTVSRVRDQLVLAEKKQDIAAIVLRINSPGGSPTASDSIYRQLTAYKTKNGIPIVAQLMGTAASGGYYVAMAANKLNAYPTTVTGSIGVISFGINLSGLMEKLGVANQTITSGAYKDAGSPLRPLSKAERAQLQSVVDDIYTRFVEVVEAGRPKLDSARVLELADGRVYSAVQALDNGLIDEIASLEDTLKETQKQLGAPEVRVVTYYRGLTEPSNIYSGSGPQSSLGTKEGPVARFIPRPGFYYLWWPGVPQP